MRQQSQTQGLPPIISPKPAHRWRGDKLEAIANNITAKFIIYENRIRYKVNNRKNRCAHLRAHPCI